jgi:tRNA acetyltransferase TAN1
MTVVYGKEESAKLEVLDCIFPRDPGARFLEHGYGGLLVLETSLSSDDATRILADSPTSLIFKITPVDSLVQSAMDSICSEVLRLVGAGDQSISVSCRRRGRAIASSSEVERQVGSALKEAGHTIDLEHPDLNVRIDIIGGRTTISVKTPAVFLVKMKGSGGDRAEVKNRKSTQ